MAPSDNDHRHRPSDAQLDAAIEGARNMVESKRSALTEEQDPVAQRGGGGGFSGAGGSAQGGSNSPAGVDFPADPSAETGGPRGARTSVSRTSGGRMDENGDPRGVDAAEFVEHETAVFEPGTQKKPEKRARR
jgi:hypothetical protein